MKSNKVLGSLNYFLVAVSAIVTIVFLCLPLVSYTSNIISFKGESFNGFQLLNVKFEYLNSTNVAMLSGIFAIIATVLAVLLLAAGVFMILKKFGVYDWKLDSKISDFDLVLNALASILAVLAFGVYLTAAFFKNANNDLPNFFTTVTPFAIVLFVVPVALCLAMWLNSTYLESAAKKEAEKQEQPKA